MFENDDAYFGGGSASPLNSIASGTRVGDIEMIENVDVLGLDFGQFFNGQSGSQTIAFSFDAGLLPGNALFHLGHECNNDIIGGYYDATEVPTPAAILPAILGIFGAASRKKGSDDEQLV